MECISLTSTISSDDDAIRICPQSTVTLTCTVNQSAFLTWFENNVQIFFFLVGDYENETSVVQEDPYTLTLIAVNNIMTTDQGLKIGDFTSTLEVMVDDINNGTIIDCGNIRQY